jgi:hypothetical protein
VNTPISPKKVLLIIAMAKEQVPIRTAARITKTSPNKVTEIYRVVKEHQDMKGTEILEYMKGIKVYKPQEDLITDDTESNNDE